MKTVTHIISGTVLLALASSCAQVHYRKGAQAQAYLEYSEAVRHYEKAVARKPIDSAYLGLGESYYWMNNPQKSVQWYDSATRYTELPAEHQLYYAEGLRNLGQYESARIWIGQYLAQNSGDQRAQNFRSSLDLIRDMKSDSMEYTVSPVEALDFGNRSAFSPTPYEEGMVITAEWGEDRVANDYDWTGKPFLDMVYVKMDTTTGEVSSVRQLDDDLNSKYHDGPGVFTADRNTIYFSRSDAMESGKRRRHINTNWRSSNTNMDKLFDIHLYEARRSEGEWEDARPSALNMEGYSTGHPALTADGNTMYFVSDRPGGMGMTDIWKSTRQSMGTWSQPENVRAINTEGNEMFPAVITDAEGNEMLVFSSDGHGGLGGLDLYTVPVGSERMPEHLSYPLNSSFDDFGLMTRAGMDRGYFSTNRGTPGNEVDKLYMFERRPSIYLQVTAENMEDQQPIEGATVTLYSSTTGAEAQSFQTDSMGQVITAIEPEGQYTVTVEKEGFAPETEAVSVDETRDMRLMTDTIEVTVELGPEQPVATADTLPSTALAPGRLREIPSGELRGTVNTIYYDFDRWNIRPDAARELDSVVSYMNANPRITVELAAYADCRGTDGYNMELSRKRATSAADYLINRGIRRNRLLTEHYGERELVNNCDCSEDAWGTSCTDAQHQANRRTEIRVSQLSRTQEREGAEEGQPSSQRRQNDVGETVGVDSE